MAQYVKDMMRDPSDPDKRIDTQGPAVHLIKTVLGSAPRWIEPPPGRNICLSITGEMRNKRATKGAALISFVFSDPVTPEALARTNLSHSPKVGPFIYLDNPTEGDQFRIEVSLPFDSRLSKLGFQLWNSDDPIEIRDLRVTQLAPDRPRDILINVSVDTEALPGRAVNNHLDRLIYGRFGDGEERGIPFQMKVFRELGVPATFYLEYGQCALYGDDAIKDVGKRILDQGFDLQLHLHSELLAGSLVPKPRNEWRPRLENLNEAQTRSVLSYAMERFILTKNRFPDAFRAGSYRHNPETLFISKEMGVAAHSNYRADQRANNAFDFKSDHPMRPFQWSNGLFELPITLSPEPLNSVTAEYCWERIMHHVTVNKTWLANVVLHSWSFLHRTETGLQEWKDSELVDNFRRFVETAPPGVRFVAIADVVAALVRNEIRIPLIRNPAELVRRQ